MDYDSLFKDIFYKSMQDCDNEQDSYDWAKKVFANKCKDKKVIPPTLKCIKEDKLLLKNNSPEKRNDMVITYNKIKLVSKVNYSVPNIERCNLGDNFGYRNEKTRLSLPCPCAGYLFGGFSKFFDNYNIKTQKSLLSQGSCEKYTNTKVSFTWTDWVYPTGRQGVHDKLQMKRAIINHFSRFMHLENYRDLISVKNIKFFQDDGHGHEIYQVPSKWQKYIKEQVELKMEELPTTKEN